MLLQAMLLPPVNDLANVICREIHTAGPISFARFMKLALYCPDLGFYDRFPHRIGKTGDFYTSVSVGPLFGRLLAFRFSLWLDELTSRSGRCHLVEAGAHDGQLMLDILTWFNEYAPATHDRLDYVILEPSAKRQSWQRAKLGRLASGVSWVQDWSELPPGTLRGIVFSNELLDAFPAHRFGWDARARQWFELGVTLREDRLAWCRLSRGAHEDLVSPPEVPEDLQRILPDGFTIERVPEVRSWWHRAAEALGHGYLLTFDYGLDCAAILDPDRPGGTLRAYRDHRMMPELLADPGEQDLTAHVDFNGLRSAGEAAGLRTVDLTSQGRFLTGVLEQVIQLQGPGFDWSRPARRQYQTLTHPDHLGERFKVLIQARDSI
jgi:SAM-dependent MidA family methyltransferase